MHPFFLYDKEAENTLKDIYAICCESIEKTITDTTREYFDSEHKEDRTFTYSLSVYAYGRAIERIASFLSEVISEARSQKILKDVMNVLDNEIKRNKGDGDAKS